MTGNDIQIFFVTAVKYFLTENKNRGKRISQAEIARSIGVEPPSLSGYLNGHLNYSESKRIQISYFFNRSYLEMLNLGYQLTKGNSPISLHNRPKEDILNIDKKILIPQIGDVIKVFNNVINEMEMELSPEGQEKLFNLIKKKLNEKNCEEVEKEILDIISITSPKRKRRKP